MQIFCSILGVQFIFYQVFVEVFQGFMKFLRQVFPQ